MKLTITLRELSPIIQSLNNFVQVPLPAKYSWRLGKVMKKLQSEVDEFNKSRTVLFEKYGEEIDEENQVKTPPGSSPGKQFRIKEENMEIFTKELEDLLLESLTINFDPIPLSLVEESSMTIADMANLEVFFVDDDSCVETDIVEQNSNISIEDNEEVPSNI